MSKPIPLPLLVPGRIDPALALGLKLRRQARR